MTISKAGKILFVAGIAGFIFSYFRIRELPPVESLLPSMDKEPVQVKTYKNPFTVEMNEIKYTITPLYRYEIHGMVVSYFDTGTWYNRYHEQWQDYLNIKDIGLMWGESLKSGIYKYMNFRSGNWTLYTRFERDAPREKRKKYRRTQVSNNHLITDSEDINRKIMKTNRGDQIRIEGYLSEYEHGEHFFRGTSTSRTDTGQGACETIFVTGYEILSAANVRWHNLYRISKLSIFAGFILIIVGFAVDPPIISKN